LTGILSLTASINCKNGCSSNSSADGRKDGSNSVASSMNVLILRSVIFDIKFGRFPAVTLRYTCAGFKHSLVFYINMLRMSQCNFLYFTHKVRQKIINKTKSTTNNQNFVRIFLSNHFKHAHSKCININFFVVIFLI